jgi:hypothetical protein
MAGLIVTWDGKEIQAINEDNYEEFVLTRSGLPGACNYEIRYTYGGNSRDRKQVTPLKYPDQESYEQCVDNLKNSDVYIEEIFTKTGRNPLNENSIELTVSAHVHNVGKYKDVFQMRAEFSDNVDTPRSFDVVELDPRQDAIMRVTAKLKKIQKCPQKLRIYSDEKGEEKVVAEEELDILSYMEKDRQRNNLGCTE